MMNEKQNLRRNRKWIARPEFSIPLALAASGLVTAATLAYTWPSPPDTGISKGWPVPFYKFPGFINTAHVWIFELQNALLDYLFWTVVSLIVLSLVLITSRWKRRSKSDFPS